MPLGAGHYSLLGHIADFGLMEAAKPFLGAARNIWAAERLAGRVGG
jgi:hypothetical protein